MLASMSSRAEELLLDHARRKMSANDVTTLKESLEKVCYMCVFGTMGWQLCALNPGRGLEEL